LQGFFATTKKPALPFPKKLNGHSLKENENIISH
jgi:hypothetical protein